MDNFQTIYRILTMLEKAMDCDEADLAMFDATALRVTPQRLDALMKMLKESGYVEGVTVARTTAGDIVKLTPRLAVTLKGLEFLQASPLMRQAEAKASPRAASRDPRGTVLLGATARVCNFASRGTEPLQNYPISTMYWKLSCIIDRIMEILSCFFHFPLLAFLCSQPAPLRMMQTNAL
jgi:hypothetical protein